MALSQCHKRTVSIISIALMLLIGGDVLAQHKLRVKRKDVKSLKELAEAHPETNYLVIKRAKLTELPKELALFKQLDSIDLYGNKIENIPDSAWDLLSNVAYLRLGKNPINYIPPGIAKLEKLRHLDLWNSDIYDFHPHLLTMDRLKLLDIRMTALSKAKVEEIVFVMQNTEVKTTRQCNCK